MSEETDGLGPGSQGDGAGIDPTAVALAGASREDADSFLRDRRALIASRLHHLHEQIKHLHLDMWEKRLRANQERRRCGQH